ncbi:hypothetical protein GCM10009737_34430 [Nocardioides lentus]|uniref:DUF3099 domain-containing protein n=1 Tax=Nocardioides lentus TaxID=338077 RepID=A0ABN2PUB0_9ACTN
MHPTTRRRVYLTLMLTCVALILLAWNVVRLWSVPVAVGMSVVAAVLPPVAAFVANAGVTRERGGPGLERRSWDRRPPPDPDR